MLALPIYDLPTRNASGFLIRHVLPRAFPPQLIGPADRKALFDTMTIGDLIVGVGHGSPSEFCGTNDQVLMDVDSIPPVEGKVVILISCQTAQELGPALIDAGAVSYIGFREDLVWIADADKASTPWSDEMAAPLMIPLSDCVNTVLNGVSVGSAYKNLLASLSKRIEEEEDELMQSCLRFNLKNAVQLGDAGARVKPRPKIKFPIPPPPIIVPLKQ